MAQIKGITHEQAKTMERVLVNSHDAEIFLKILGELGNETKIEFGKIMFVVAETGEEKDLFDMITPAEFATKDLL